MVVRSWAIVTQGQEVLDITWSIYCLKLKPTTKACQLSMRYGSEENKQIKELANIRCRIKIQWKRVKISCEMQYVSQTCRIVTCKWFY